jgi:hypothetical protein
MTFMLWVFGMHLATLQFKQQTTFQNQIGLAAVVNLSLLNTTNHADSVFSSLFLFSSGSHWHLPWLFRFLCRKRNVIPM